MIIGYPPQGNQVGYGPHIRYGGGIPRLVEDHPLAANLLVCIVPLNLGQPKVYEIVNQRLSDGGGGGSAYAATFERSSTNTGDVSRRFAALATSQHHVPETGVFGNRLRTVTNRVTLAWLGGLTGGTGGTSGPNFIGYQATNKNYCLYRKAFGDESKIVAGYYNGSAREAVSASSYYQSASSFQPKPNHIVAALDIAAGTMDCYFNGDWKEQVSGLNTTSISYAGTGGVYFAGNEFSSNSVGGFGYIGWIWRDVLQQAHVRALWDRPFELLEEEGSTTYYVFTGTSPPPPPPSNTNYLMPLLGVGDD